MDSENKPRWFYFRVNPNVPEPKPRATLEKVQKDLEETQRALATLECQMKKVTFQLQQLIDLHKKD